MKSVKDWAKREVLRSGLPPHVDKLVDKTCHDCRFYCKDTKTCDYLIVTEKCRPCPPGKGCTAKEAEIVQNGKRVKWDAKRARELYLQGMNDPQIAKEVGTTSYTIGCWRRRNNLPPQNPHREYNRDWDKEEARRLYDMGMGDNAIGRAVGVGASVIWKWRKKAGLPPNGK